MSDRPLPQPIHGRCGVCDWPTNTLPCPYCTRAAVFERDIAEIHGETEKESA